MDILLGAGRDHTRKMNAGRGEWKDLVTVDFNSDHNPDVVWDLENISLPFDNNSADEIHAYNVLEHTGNQGDWKFFFDQFSDFWRILKPNGYLFAITPMWNDVWAFGDPSHKRVINKGSLPFLSQKQYSEQVGKTPMTDYRFYYKADFECVAFSEGENFQFVLKAVK